MYATSSWPRLSGRTHPSARVDKALYRFVLRKKSPIPHPQSLAFGRSERDPVGGGGLTVLLTCKETQKQAESVVTGPLPENAFIQQQTLSLSAIEHSTVSRRGEVHRKREVLALARLKAAAERREIADQAKFDATIAKIREEEEKIKLSAQRRKEELEAKKIAAEERKKTLLEEKRIAAEDKKKASEEKKRKALEEKLAMADKRREAMEEKKRKTEEAKRLRAEEKKRIAEEKKRLCKTAYDEEEAMFLINQSDEMERRQLFLQTQEETRQEAWKQQIDQQENTRIEAELQEKNVREATRQEAERSAAPVKRSAASSSQSIRGFKKPRRVNMLDELR
ncbi:hypothetical protein D1007_02156 [Hordeum vulgare]|nr:hypothetical protein D1007_02156 [Hordeum vulgare]